MVEALVDRLNQLNEPWENQGIQPDQCLENRVCPNRAVDLIGPLGAPKPTQGESSHEGCEHCRDSNLAGSEHQVQLAFPDCFVHKRGCARG